MLPIHAHTEREREVTDAGWREKGREGRSDWRVLFTLSLSSIVAPSYRTDFTRMN